MVRKNFQVAFELSGKLDSSFHTVFAGADKQMRGLSNRSRELNVSMRNLARLRDKGILDTANYNVLMNEQKKKLQKVEQAHAGLERAHRLDTKVQNLRTNSYGHLMDAVSKGAMFASPIRSAMEFETAMAGVRKVVDFDSPEEFKEMSRDILNLSKKIPMASTELADLYQAGGQGGVAKEELNQFAESAAKMGVAFDITGGDAGQLMAEWRAAFKMNQTEVVELADKINYLGNKGAASATQISEVVQRIGPLGEVGGLASGEIAALGSSLVEVGIAPEVASTGIKKLITTLTSGEMVTETQKKAFEKLGFSATDMAKRMQEDATGAITDLLGAIKNAKPEEQVSLLKQFFGEDVGPTLAPLLNNLERLQELLDMVGENGEWSGSMEKEFEAMTDTTEAQLQIFINNLKTLANLAGEHVLPMLNDWIDKGKEYAQVISNWIEQHPKLAGSLMKGASAFIAISAAVSGLKFAGSLLLSPFVKFVGLIAKMRALPTVLQASATAAKSLGKNAPCDIGGTVGKKKKGKKKKGKSKTSKSGEGFKKVAGNVGGTLLSKGVMKGAGKLALRAVPVVGTALTAYSVGKWAYDKAGGWDGIKTKLNHNKTLAQQVQQDSTRAISVAGSTGGEVAQQFFQPISKINMPVGQRLNNQFGVISNSATVHGNLTGSNFRGQLASTIGQTSISSPINKQFNTTVGTAGIYGAQTGSNFTNQLTGPLNQGSITSGVNNGFGSVVGTAGVYGNLTGLNYGAGIQSNLATVTTSSPLIAEWQSTAMAGATIGAMTGMMYARGIVMTPIPTSYWLQSYLIQPLVRIASSAYIHGLNIAQSIARGLAAGRLSIAREVSQIATLARRASTINVSVKGSSDVPRYAKGGIIDRAHIGMVGEAGPEAIIPLNNKSRSHGLLNKTASMMGYNLSRPANQNARIEHLSTRESERSIQLNYSPQIIVQGDASKKDMKELLSDDKNKIEKLLKNIAQRKERVSFG